MRHKIFLYLLIFIADLVLVSIILQQKKHLSNIQ